MSNAIETALTLVREIAEREPYTAGHEAWPYCFFCGNHSDESHKANCLWERAYKLALEL